MVTLTDEGRGSLTVPLVETLAGGSPGTDGRGEVRSDTRRRPKTHRQTHRRGAEGYEGPYYTLWTVDLNKPL